MPYSIWIVLTSNNIISFPVSPKNHIANKYSKNGFTVSIRPFSFISNNLLHFIAIHASQSILFPKIIIIVVLAVIWCLSYFCTTLTFVAITQRAHDDWCMALTIFEEKNVEILLRSLLESNLIQNLYIAMHFNWKWPNDWRVIAKFYVNLTHLELLDATRDHILCILLSE